MKTSTIAVTGYHRTLVETFRYWILSQFPSLEVETFLVNPSVEAQWNAVTGKDLTILLIFYPSDLSRAERLLSRYAPEESLVIYREDLGTEALRTDLPTVSFHSCIEYLRGVLHVGDGRDTGEKRICFTPRESEVLDLFARGMSVKEVAWELKISKYTVAAHQRKLYLKTDSHTLQQLTLYASLHHPSRSLPASQPGDRE